MVLCFFDSAQRLGNSIFAARQDQKSNSPASERRPAVTDSFARDRLLSFAATWI